MLNRLLYSPFLTQMVVTRRCNLSCAYCNEYDQVSDPVPYETLTARIDKIKALGCFALELTGGEPMMHPRIFDLIRYSRDKRFTKTMMISNAFLFNEAKVGKLNDAGLQELQISVDGVTPNDITVKVLNPLRRKLLAVQKVAKFTVVLSAVLGAAPPAEVLEVVKFAKEHGFRPRVLVLHDGQGRVEMTTEQLALYAQVKEALGERFKEAHDYRTRIVETGSAPFKCRAGSRYLYVSEFGKVHWCSQTRETFGIPLEDYTKADLKTQFDTFKSCNPTCTLGCARSTSRVDEWRPQRRQPPAA